MPCGLVAIQISICICKHNKSEIFKDTIGVCAKLIFAIITFYWDKTNMVFNLLFKSNINPFSSISHPTNIQYLIFARV